jgi:hypothetical protein
VPESDRESNWRGPDAFVLGNAQVERLHAVQVGALAQKRYVGRRFRDILDSLVYLAPERLIPGTFDRLDAAAFCLHENPFPAESR